MIIRFFRKKRKEFKKTVFNYFSQHLSVLNKKIFKKLFKFEVHLEIEEHLVYYYNYHFIFSNIEWQLSWGTDGWWVLTYRKLSNKYWTVSGLSKNLSECVDFLFNEHNKLIWNKKFKELFKNDK